MDRRTILTFWAAAGLSAALPGTEVATATGKTQMPGGGGSIDGTSRLPVPATGPVRVAFLLSTDAAVVDFAGPWGVFEYVAAPNMGQAPFELFTVAEDSTALKASGGLSLVPDYTLANAPQPNVIVVPAQSEPTDSMLAWLRRASVGADLTMSVCTGAYVLARAGMLDGRIATTHHGALARYAADFPAISFKRGARFVDAGKVSTAGGLTSGIDLALHVVERYFGRDVAERTAMMLEYQGLGWKDPDSNVAFLKRPVSTDEHPLCPVCDMEVDRHTAPTEIYQAHRYYFCSDADRQRFDLSPEKFLGT